MDVQAFALYFLIQLLASSDAFTYDVKAETEMRSDDAGRSCMSTYKTCKLNMEDIHLAAPPSLPATSGPKGEQGEKGIKGDEGEKGPAGDRGEQGLPGLQGSMGGKGDQGLKGDKGEQGLKGDQGKEGLPGLMGLKGDPGEKGVGIKGDRGAKGEPGQRGLDGICPCREESPEEDNINDEGLGQEDNPLVTTCKTNKIKSGDYFVKVSRVFKVFCNMTSLLTCTKSKSAGAKYTYVINETTWLNVHETINPGELYGVTSEEITWFQERSFVAKQTLRVHYHKFKPEFSPEDTTITLLGWNDVPVKPYPTPSTPFRYVSTPMSDDCDPEVTWCYVDLEMVSGSKNRLPIIDVHINLPKDKNIELKLEHIELCYG